MCHTCDWFTAASFSVQEQEEKEEILFLAGVFRRSREGEEDSSSICECWCEWRGADSGGRQTLVKALPSETSEAVEVLVRMERGR